MTIEVEVPENIAEQLDSPAEFASKAVQDRISVYGQSLRILDEEGWTGSEMRWATAVLRDHSEMRAVGVDQAHHVAAELEDSTEFPDQNPERFDISEERWKDLVKQARDKDAVAYALVFATRDYFAIDGNLELQEA